MRIRTLCISVLLLASCSPQLDGDSCDGDDQCLAGEICREGRCTRGERSPDTDDDLDSDAPTDSADLDRGDDPTAVDETSDAETDETVEPTCGTGEQLEHGFRLHPYLVCGAQNNPGDCSREYRDEGCSSRPRLDQLVEIPLTAGINDIAIAYYGSFDVLSNVLANTGGGTSDAGGFDLNGEASATRYSDTGYYEGALKLSGGTLDFDPNPLQDATAWTIAFWLRPCEEAPTDEDDDAVDCGELPLTVFNIKSGSDSVLELVVDQEAMTLHHLRDTEQADAIPSYRSASAGWDHFAMVYTPDGLLSVFINGSAVTTSFEIPLFHEGDDFYLGVSSGQPTAVVDEFIVARRAFRHPEIDTLMNGRPFGSVLAGRHDFGDVRIAEELNGEWVMPRQELVGPVSGGLLSGIEGGC